MGTVIIPFINEKHQESVVSYKMKEQDFAANLVGLSDYEAQDQGKSLGTHLICLLLQGSYLCV